MSETMSELRYLKLWGAGKMIAGPFDEQELMSWAAGEIERLTAENERLQSDYRNLKMAVDGSEGLKCPQHGCNDSGGYPRQISETDCEEVQCEFCWTVSDSVFMRCRN